MKPGQGTSANFSLGVDGYDDLTEIGRGGFAVVFRAREREFSRTVAIKVLTTTLDEKARRRFDHERRAIGSLSGHPNIVTVYASGITPDGQPFIVMEFMPEGSLADRLAHGPLPWSEATVIGNKLASAVQAAHDAGVLHRDIKPENVLVSGYGEPKLADFGIARLQDGTRTEDGTVVATVAHAAPEVLAGEPAGERSDVYSLASTIYALIAGEPAFVRSEDESILPIYSRVASEPVPDLRPRGVPQTVCSLLERSMAKDPTERIGSASELSIELTDLEAGPGDTSAVEPPAPLIDRAAARHRPSAARLDKPRRARLRARKWWLVAAPLAVVVAIASIVGGLVIASSRGSDEGPSPATIPNVTDLGDELVAMINDLRVERGIPELVPDDGLTDQARAWAAEIAAIGTPNASPSLDLVNADLGNAYLRLGENTLSGSSVADIHEATVETPDFLENLTQPVYDVVGVGVVYRRDRKTLFVVEYFGQRRDPLAADSQVPQS